MGTLNTFGGSGNTFTLNAGTLNMNHAAALGNVNNTFVINDGTINNTTAAALTLNNYKQTWNGNFAFTGTRNLNMGTGAVTMNNHVQITANANTLTLGGTISDDGNSRNLTKSGAGNVTLNAAASHGGNTLVQQGTLTLGSAGLITSSPVIDVANGATMNVSAVSGGFELGFGQTLQGNGTVVGAMTAGDGSTISPGNSPGKLTVGDLTLAGNSTVRIEVGGMTTPGVDYDVIESLGMLTYQSGWKLQVVFTDSTPFSGTLQVLDFASYSGTFDPDIELVGMADEPITYNRTTGEITFVNAMIPEPGTSLLISLGLGFLLFFRNGLANRSRPR